MSWSASRSSHGSQPSPLAGRAMSLCRCSCSSFAATALGVGGAAVTDEYLQILPEMARFRSASEPPRQSQSMAVRLSLLSACIADRSWRMPACLPPLYATTRQRPARATTAPQMTMRFILSISETQRRKSASERSGVGSICWLGASSLFLVVSRVVNYQREVVGPWAEPD